MATNITAMSAATVANNRIRFISVPFPERAGLVSPAVLHNETKYEGLQGLAQLPRTRLLGTWVNKPAVGREQPT
jgi:hypothetical protein